MIWWVSLTSNLLKKNSWVSYFLNSWIQNTWILEYWKYFICLYTQRISLAHFFKISRLGRDCSILLRWIVLWRSLTQPVDVWLPLTVGLRSSLSLNFRNVTGIYHDVDHSVSVLLWRYIISRGRFRSHFILRTFYFMYLTLFIISLCWNFFSLLAFIIFFFCIFFDCLKPLILICALLLLICQFYNWVFFHHW